MYIDSKTVPDFDINGSVLSAVDLERRGLGARVYAAKIIAIMFGPNHHADLQIIFKPTVYKTTTGLIQAFVGNLSDKSKYFTPLSRNFGFTHLIEAFCLTKKIIVATY